MKTLENKSILELESFRKELQSFSKENKDIIFRVHCTNYADNKFYYLKNGIFCIAESFNTKYDFNYNKISLSKLKRDGIYKAIEIERTNKNIQCYNL